MTNSHISIATTNDIPKLVSVINSAYRGQGSQKGWTSETDLFDGLRINIKTLTELMDNKNAVILKYVNDNVVLGCVYLQKQHSQIYLGLLSVSPDIQASGIGKQLLTAAEEYARENNYLKIVMTVITVRTELVDWYKRRGYKPTGEVKPFPVDSIDTPNQKLELFVLEKIVSKEL